MTTCCVTGCKNRPSATRKLKFYSLPSGSRPFQANRRFLWVQAIKEVTGCDAEELQRDVRVCSAHFISGRASMAKDSPDFVPSVFTCAKREHNVSSKKRVKRINMYSGRRKFSLQCRTGKLQTEEAPPVVLKSFVKKETAENELSEDTRIPSPPAVLKKRKTLTTEAEAIQKTPSPNKMLPSFKVPTDIPQLSKMRPVVLLKQVVSPAGGYQCEQCNQNFTDVSQFIKHKRQHDDDDEEEEEDDEDEEQSFPCKICGIHFTSQTLFVAHQRVHKDEPSFPCNMCDRSFPTSHELKRHKLRHVRDGRKCRQCGVLFCKRHNHVLFVPQTEAEQDSFIEPQQLLPESRLEMLGPSQAADLVVDAGSSRTISPQLAATGKTVVPTTTIPAPKSHEAALPASASTILSEIPMPTMIKRKPSSKTRLSRKPSTSFQFKAPQPPNYPAVFNQPHLPLYPEVQSSLQIFSPQCLTSALLEVKRNYEYIFSEEMEVKLKEMMMKKEKKKMVHVKEEQCEAPLIPPDKQSPAQVKKERMAYDLEIVL